MTSRQKRIEDMITAVVGARNYHGDYNPLWDLPMAYVKKTNIANPQMRKNRTRFNKKRKTTKRRGLIKRQIPRAITTSNKLIRCKTSDFQTLDCASGALAMLPVSGTNIVDPFGSNGAGQPLGYDQWKTLYRTAYVLGAKVKCTIWNNQSTAVMYGINVMDRNQGTVALTNYEYYKEVPSCVSRLLSPDIDHGYVSMKTSTKRALHIRDIKDNTELRNNLVSDAAPTENYYFHVWVQPTDQTSSLTAVHLVVDVEYIILLTNPIIPARSSG